MTGSRRILWDCSHVAAVPHENTGIERVVRQLGAALLQAGPELGFEVVPCVTDGTSRIRRLDSIPQTTDPPPADAGRVVRPTPEDVWVLADHAWDAGRLIGLSPWWREGMRVVLFQYDLVPLRFPETTTPLTATLFSRWMFEAVSFADAIVSISGATATGLVETLPALAPWREFRPSELPVVHLASTWHPERPAALRAPGDPCRLISVGTVEPRKRYDVLLDAMEGHWNAGGRTELHIVGRAGWATGALQKRMSRLEASGDRFRWVAGATDEDLRNEYLGSSAFVSVSSEEGFGLPVVEAAAAGLPLILSDIPVYREVAGDQARFVAAPAQDTQRELEAVLGELDTGSVELARPDIPLARRRWAEAATDLCAAIAALPEPDLELRHRWDHRAALSLVGSYRTEQGREAAPTAPSEPGEPPVGRPGTGWRERLSRRRADLRLRIPVVAVRFIRLRNQAFRLFQQLDARTSTLENRLAELVRVGPTANALQQIRAAEAEQSLRYELESLLAEIEGLIDETWGPPPGDAPRGAGPDGALRGRVASLRRRLRSGDDA